MERVLRSWIFDRSVGQANLGQRKIVTYRYTSVHVHMYTCTFDSNSSLLFKSSLSLLIIVELCLLLKFSTQESLIFSLYNYGIMDVNVQDVRLYTFSSFTNLYCLTEESANVVDFRRNQFDQGRLVLYVRTCTSVSGKTWKLDQSWILVAHAFVCGSAFVF